MHRLAALPRVALLASVFAGALVWPRVGDAQPGCPAAASWDAFARCALKGESVEVVHHLPSGKLVKLVGDRLGTHRLGLFVRRDGLWTRLPFQAALDDTTEVLGSQELGAGAYRVDIGQAVARWVTLDQVTTRPALQRLRFTHVCTLDRGCLAVMIGCELLVRGKVIAGYRGELAWQSGAVTLRADLRAQHDGYCRPPRNIVVEEPGA